jgi:hypothetical protein
MDIVAEPKQPIDVSSLVFIAVGLLSLEGKRGRSNDEIHGLVPKLSEKVTSVAYIGFAEVRLVQRLG